MTTSTLRRPDTVRESMKQHRAMLREDEQQAAGLEQDPQRQDHLSAAYGLWVALTIMGFLGILGVLVYNWVQS